MTRLVVHLIVGVGITLAWGVFAAFIGLELWKTLVGSTVGALLLSWHLLRGE